MNTSKATLRFHDTDIDFGSNSYKIIQKLNEHYTNSDIIQVINIGLVPFI
jgi:hypothetical protein